MSAWPNEHEGNRFVRPNELRHIIGLSRTSIWRLERAGQFPARRQISPGAVGYLMSDIEAFMASRRKVEEVQGK